MIRGFAGVYSLVISCNAYVLSLPSSSSAALSPKHPINFYWEFVLIQTILGLQTLDFFYCNQNDVCNASNVFGMSTRVFLDWK
ncbi:hypothetical protein V8C35DRAFT_314761 [Trichoderma chlorosporum]